MASLKSRFLSVFVTAMLLECYVPEDNTETPEDSPVSSGDHYFYLPTDAESDEDSDSIN